MRKQHQSTALQCRAFDTRVTAPGKGCKPKLWGFHRRRNDVPSLCVVLDGAGHKLHVVKSPPSRHRPLRIK
jgi:hypothetical protein